MKEAMVELLGKKPWEEQAGDSSDQPNGKAGKAMYVVGQNHKSSKQV